MRNHPLLALFLPVRKARSSTGVWVKDLFLRSAINCPPKPHTERLPGPVEGQD